MPARPKKTQEDGLRMPLYLDIMAFIAHLSVFFFGLQIWHNFREYQAGVEHGGHQIWQQITGIKDSDLNKNHAKYQPPSSNGF